MGGAVLQRSRRRPRRAVLTILGDVDVHLIDGTYELFRHYYALPTARVADGRNVAACGALSIDSRDDPEGATHLGVATDHVIESFAISYGRDIRQGQGSMRS